MATIHDITVLVVDDQPSMRMLHRQNLRELGIRTVIEAGNGFEALEILRKQPIRLIMSDWNMGEMDGLTFFRRLQEHPMLRRVPFIMITGNVEADNVKLAIKSGVKVYLAKPYTLNALRSRIEACIGKLETFVPPRI